MVPPSSHLPVKFTPAARDDLDVVFAFVNDRNRAAAVELLARLMRATEQLSAFPEMGAPLPPEEYGFVAPGIRFVIVEPYLVFYRIADDHIAVVRILHARQDSLGELFE